MLETDLLIRIIDKEKQFRLFIASTTNLVNEGCRRHKCSATAAAALGRVLTATVMMAADLKDENDSLTLKINGSGPAGTILATGNNIGEVRGFISEPQADLPSKYPGKLAVGDLIGTDGYLEVVRDMGMEQPFTGRVKLISGEIAEDLAHYFLQSEQIPSLVALGVLVDVDLTIKSAGGIFVQALPGADDNVLAKIETNIQSLGSISHLMAEKNIQQIIPEIMEGIEYEVLERKPLSYRCKCNRERLVNIMAGISMEELESISKEQDQVEVICNYCQEVYNLDINEIMHIKAEKP